MTEENKNARIITSLFDLLDDYLIGDLDTMVIEISARPSGGVGFPSIQTILSGMELLGRLLSGGKTDEQAFNHFWDEYFVKDNPNYDSPRLKKIFRYSIRNGTAHYFLVKFGIRLSKQDKSNLARTPNNELNIDIITLYKDFKKTYERIKEKLLEVSGKKGSLMAQFQKGYKKLLEDLRVTRVDIDEYIRSLPETSHKPLAGDSGIGPLATLSWKKVTYESLASTTRLPDEMLNQNTQKTTTSGYHSSDDSVIRLPNSRVVDES